MNTEIFNYPKNCVMESLKNYDKRNCFNEFKDFKIQNIQTQFVHIYQVQTLLETRNLDKEKVKAHEKRLAVDGPENYNALHDNEWNYHVERPGKLPIEFMRVPIPGTEIVIRCEECDCIDNLWRRGQKPCTKKNCDHHCKACFGSKFVECTKCEATGKCRQFTEMTIRWRVDVQEIYSASAIPLKKLRISASEEVFSCQSLNVESLLSTLNLTEDFSFVAKCQKSLGALTENLIHNQRIVDQYHVVKRIAVAKVDGVNSNGKSMSVYSYGKNEIFIPKHSIKR